MERANIQQDTRTVIEGFWSIVAESENRNRKWLKAFLQFLAVSYRAILCANQIVFGFFGGCHGSRYSLEFVCTIAVGRA